MSKANLESFGGGGIASSMFKKEGPNVESLIQKVACVAILAFLVPLAFAQSETATSLSGDGNSVVESVPMPMIEVEISPEERAWHAAKKLYGNPDLDLGSMFNAADLEAVRRISLVDKDEIEMGVLLRTFTSSKLCQEEQPKARQDLAEILDRMEKVMAEDFENAVAEHLKSLSPQGLATVEAEFSRWSSSRSEIDWHEHFQSMNDEEVPFFVAHLCNRVSKAFSPSGIERE